MKRLLVIVAAMAAIVFAACVPEGSPNGSPAATGQPGASLEPSTLRSDDLSSEMPSVEVSPQQSTTP